MKPMFCLAVLAMATAGVQNAAANPAGEHRRLSMLFDLKSLDSADQLRAQAAAIAFVENQMAPNDSLEIMTYTSERFRCEVLGQRGTGRSKSLERLNLD